MTHRQTANPTEWMILDERLGSKLCNLVRKLPRRSGVLFLRYDLLEHERRKLLSHLTRIAKAKRLTIIDEKSRGAARVHDSEELLRALARRRQLIFLSPIFPTQSHPNWKPLPRMRAATFARLAHRKAIALGGMDRRRFRTIQKLGFAGWAGIDAWIRT